MFNNVSAAFSAPAPKHGIGFAAVFAADAELDVGPGLAALLDDDLHGVGWATRLPERVSLRTRPTPVWSIVAKGGRPPGLLLHDLEFRVAGQEAAGVVTRQAGAACVRSLVPKLIPPMRDGGLRDLVGQG